jgi:DeoR/GlpR family transcriptional regulator of sugar metabolism
MVEKFRDEVSGEEMVRIKCNICKESKNLKSETYQKMLKRFSFTRSFLFGMTHGIEAVLTNRPIQATLSKEEMEKAFQNVYVCKECKNNKEETLKITESISRILNLPIIPKDIDKESDKDESKK